MSPRRLLPLLLCAFWMLGCAGGFQAPWGQALSAQSYRQQALELEKQGELRQALFAWRVAAALAPEDERIPANIQTLERGIDQAADAHFKKGVSFFEAGNASQAEREFLIVLRLTPDHARAIFFLKTRTQYPNQKIYKVQRGDSLSKIAIAEYNDPSKASIIAAFNDLDPQKPLPVDTSILLPRLTSNQLLPRKETSTLLQKAKKALEKGQYQEVLTITGKIKAYDPDNAESQNLRDTAHFAIGNRKMENNDYFAALEHFMRVRPGYQGREMAIAKAELSIEQQTTDEKLRAAQEHLAQGDYAAAIGITSELLAQDRSNPKARELSDAAHYALGKQLMEQGQEIRAIEALSALPDGYQDKAQLLSQAHARLNALAEDFYRKGVKHFLNEELEQAIASWEQALSLNPNHPKARQDIDNASRLLEKWRDMD